MRMKPLERRKYPYGIQVFSITGLAIEKLETEWTPYPILHFDMSLGKHLDKDALIRYLHHLLQKNEASTSTAKSIR